MLLDVWSGVSEVLGQVPVVLFTISTLPGQEGLRKEMLLCCSSRLQSSHGAAADAAAGPSHKVPGDKITSCLVQHG